MGFYEDGSINYQAAKNDGMVEGCGKYSGYTPHHAPGGSYRNMFHPYTEYVLEAIMTKKRIRDEKIERWVKFYMEEDDIEHYKLMVSEGGQFVEIEQDIPPEAIESFMPEACADMDNYYEDMEAILTADVDEWEHMQPYEGWFYSNVDWENIYDDDISWDDFRKRYWRK